ncbi:MAG: cytochrome c [bacterium]
MRRLATLSVVLLSSMMLLATTGCPPKKEAPKSPEVSKPAAPLGSAGLSSGGDTSAGGTETPAAGTTETPANNDMASGAITNDADAALAKGYAENCAKCHGANGEGVPDKGPAYNKVAKASDEDWVKTILEGSKDKMPAFKDKVTEDQAKALAAWIRANLVTATG